MINIKLKSDNLKSKIMKMMDTGVKLTEIFRYFPEIAD
jgi:hypothetical protein